MTVRPITDQAEAYATHKIVAELTAAKDFNPAQKIGNEERIQRFVHQLISNPRYVLLGAFDDRGAAMGYICGEVRPDIYTNDLCGFELVWLVADPYKKTGVGLALLEGWEQECKRMGAVRSYMGVGAFYNSERVKKIYADRGYVLYSESHFKKL